MESKKDIRVSVAETLLNVGNKIDLKANEAYCDAPHTFEDNRLVEGEGSFLGGVFKDLAAEGIATTDTLGMAGKGNPAMAIAGVKL